MNKNILTIALLFIMLFMISCSAQKYEIEDETHTETVTRVNAAANASAASNYIFSDEPEDETPQAQPYDSTPQIVNTQSTPITEDTASNIDTPIDIEDKYKGLYTNVYNKTMPPLETKIFKQEQEQANEAKKEKEKEKKKKPAQKKPGTLISSFKTFFNAANKPRVSNIKRAAEKLNGAVIKPGRVFSFNRYIGPTGDANGYKPATVIVQGKETKGYGGGVCQVSTTLFNACEEAGMDVLERHSHSKKVPYVQEGRDAAISYGGIDFKFKNSKDYSVRIKTHVGKGTIVVSVEKI